MEPHPAAVGGHLHHTRQGAVGLHAVGLVPEAEKHIRPDAQSRQLPGGLVHGRGADAASHQGDAPVLRRQGGQVKAVAHRPRQLQAVPGLEGGQLPGALPHQLVEEGDGQRLALPLVDADGPGQERPFPGAPAAQGEELPRVGGVGRVRPEHLQQPDVRLDGGVAQHLGFTAGCTHGRWPPSYPHTRCRPPRQRPCRAAFCRPAGCPGWS